MALLGNFGRSKAQTPAASYNEGLAASPSSHSSGLRKSGSSKTEDTTETKVDATGRPESFPKIRTTQILQLTEPESTVSLPAEIRKQEVSKVEWDNSGSTNLGDPDSTMLSVAETLSQRPSQPSLADVDDADILVPITTPLAPSPGDQQSDETPNPPNPDGVRKNVGDLSERRLAVVQRRHEAQECRSGLRQAREALDILDARFIQAVRVIYASSRSSGLAHLFELVEAMQSQRDKFYPMEDDYNRLEDRLDLEEFELHEAESRLYERLGSPRISIVAADDQASLWRKGSLEVQPKHLAPEDEEPAYTDYLSRVGDANIVKERILDLRRERMHLVEEERIRAKVGRTLDEEAFQFLDSFDTRHQELQDQYAAIQEDLARMREGLPWSVPLPFATTQFADESYSFGTRTIQQLMDASPLITASDLASSTSPSTPPSPHDATTTAPLPRADPLLLPYNDTSPTFSFTDSSECGPVSTVTYVNEWLLNRLRRSSMEVWRFKSAEELQALELDGVEVRDLVIQWWSKDEKAGDFLSKEKAAAISLSLSPNPGIEYKPTRMAWSDGVPHEFERLATRLPRADATVRREVVSINFRHKSNELRLNNRLPMRSI